MHCQGRPDQSSPGRPTKDFAAAGAGCRGKSRVEELWADLTGVGRGAI
jgi:hypothetical protein